MRPGTYDKYVTVWKSPQTSGDDDGFFEALSPPDWWCSVQPLDPVGGDDRSTSYRVEGRYHPQITVDTRILYGTLELFVRGVQDVSLKGREMRLYCETVAP
jgi:hypothetical protein